jgi:hypothetical protein
VTVREFGAIVLAATHHRMGEQDFAEKAKPPRCAALGTFVCRRDARPAIERERSPADPRRGAGVGCSGRGGTMIEPSALAAAGS